MSKRTPKEDLRSFSWIYIILAVVYAIATILVLVIPEIANKLTEGLGKSGLLSIGVTGVVTVLGNLWYFWLARRVADGKSNGTLYMVLLALGVVGYVITVFTTPSSFIGALTLDFIVDACGLGYMYAIRKELNK